MFADVLLVSHTHLSFVPRRSKEVRTDNYGERKVQTHNVIASSVASQFYVTLRPCIPNPSFRGYVDSRKKLNEPLKSAKHAPSVDEVEVL